MKSNKKRQTALFELGRAPPDLDPYEYEVLLQLRKSIPKRRRTKRIHYDETEELEELEDAEEDATIDPEDDEPLA